MLALLCLLLGFVLGVAAGFCLLAWGLLNELTRDLIRECAGVVDNAHQEGLTMKFEIVNDRLVVNGKPVRYVQTKHMGGRIEAVAVVLHDTAGGPPGDSVGWLTTDAKNTGKASCHLIVLRNVNLETGEGIIQLAPFDRKTNHAGVSTWKGSPNCNGRMIGIEMQNPGELYGTPEKASSTFGKSWGRADGVKACPADQYHKAGCWLPYGETQLAAVELTIGALGRAYASIAEVVGHHHISPGRKVDPTPLMDWARMRSALPARAPTLSKDLVKQGQQGLVARGYHLPSVDGVMGPWTREKLRTFQEQNGLPVTGELDAASFDLLTKDPKVAGKPMPTGSREEAVQAGVGGKDWDTILVRWGLKAEGAFEVGKGIADVADHVNKAGEAVAVVEEGKGVLGRIFALLEPVAAWAITPRGATTILTIAVCAAGWYVVRRFEMKRQDKRRTGALMEA